MALKLKEEFGMSLSITNFMEDGMSMNLELPTFSSNIKKRSM
jgi:hypothetical protein